MTRPSETREAMSIPAPASSSYVTAGSRSLTGSDSVAPESNVPVNSTHGSLGRSLRAAHVSSVTSRTPKAPPLWPFQVVLPFEQTLKRLSAESDDNEVLLPLGVTVD